METIFRNLVSFDVCNVCKLIVDDQRILPCGHAFCLKCLESQITSEDVKPPTITESKCPICKVAFHIPEGGLIELNKFEVLGSLVVSSRKCDVCCESLAIKFCVDCSYNYCASCLQVHEKLPATSKHQLESIDRQASGKDKLDANIDCEKHFETVIAFCKDCSFLLCDQCLESDDHADHGVELVKDFFDSIRITLEKTLKIKLETLANVVSNHKVVEDVMWDSKMEAANLKEIIKGRGEELKEAVDTIVADLIKNVDEDLKEHLFKVESVTMELDNMKANLNLQIKTLIEQLDDMRHNNVAYKPPSVKEGFLDIPKYSKMFNTSLVVADDFFGDLKNLVGTLRAEPELELSEQRILNGKIRGRANSFAVSPKRIFTCNWEESRVDVFEGANLTSSYDFKKKLSQVHDLLVINDDLYILGRRGILYDGVVKIDVSLNDSPREIYTLSSQENICCLSRSCSAKLLLVLSRKLLHLSENGELVKSLDLSFDIYDALQVDETRYFVCCRNEEVCVIDDNGEKIATYCDKRQIKSPYRMAKDNYGFVLLTDYFDKTILVLDQGLNFISSHNTGEYLFKILYDHKEDSLLALSNCNKLLTFKL